MLPTTPKVAREITMVGWPLRLPARVPSPSGMNDSATPASVATMACRRLTPNAKMIAPKTTAAMEEFAANQSQNSRAERPTRCSIGVGSRPTFSAVLTGGATRESSS
jgi:hypothetical protein